MHFKVSAPVAYLPNLKFKSPDADRGDATQFYYEGTNLMKILLFDGCESTTQVWTFLMPNRLAEAFRRHWT